MAQLIEYGGPLRVGDVRETLIPCRCRPAGLGCPGLMAVLKQKDDALLALCPACQQDEFLIYEWQDTPWAHGPKAPRPVPGLAQEVESPEAREPRASDNDVFLSRALKVLGARMTGEEVRRLISASDHPEAKGRQRAGGTHSSVLFE